MELALKGRAGLYKIQAPDGQVLTDGVPIREACELTGLSKSCIQQAAANGHRAGKKYRVQKVDAIIDIQKDADLLEEYDQIRTKLLKYRRKEK